MRKHVNDFLFGQLICLTVMNLEPNVRGSFCVSHTHPQYPHPCPHAQTDMLTLWIYERVQIGGSLFRTHRSFIRAWARHFRNPWDAKLWVDMCVVSGG